VLWRHESKHWSMHRLFMEVTLSTTREKGRLLKEVLVEIGNMDVGRVFEDWELGNSGCWEEPFLPATEGLSGETGCCMCPARSRRWPWR